jgi:hypothetical protein
VRLTGLVVSGSATACLAVNGVNVACQSVGFTLINAIEAVPVTALVSLNAGDVVTVRVKGTSTNAQVAGATDSMSVVTIASVD